jgi:hypothetical protein
VKRYVLIFAATLCAAGCGRAPQEILARVNNYEITKAEFEAEFKDSSYGKTDTLASRREFLSTLITRKLILQDAARRGLDRDRDFLKTIERFWEQSLSKQALDRKTKEIAKSVAVNEKAAEDAYREMVREGKAGKPYDQLRDQIKRELVKTKEAQMMDGWVAELREKASITINEESLSTGRDE